MAATKLLVIGDQIAASLSGPFVDVAKKNGFEVRVDGRAGSTVADWIKNGWLAADIDAIDPDGVFIILGSNDAKGDAAGLVDTAKALATQGAAKKANVGWIAPLTGSDPGLPAVRKALADAMGDKLFPTDRWGYARAADGVSLSPTGAQGLAQDLAAWGGLAPAPSTGMSTGTKIVLGVAAVVGLGLLAASGAGLFRMRGR